MINIEDLNARINVLYNAKKASVINKQGSACNVLIPPIEGIIVIKLAHIIVKIINVNYKENALVGVKKDIGGYNVISNVNRNVKT